MEGGKVIGGQVTTLDVVPTLLEILGITPSANFGKQIAGRRSLVPYLENAGRAGYDVFTETDYRNYTHKRSIRTADGWKYILTLESGAEELYDLSADPGETTNLMAQEPAKIAQLRNVLRAHIRDDLGSDLDAPLRSDCIPVYEGQCI